MRRRGSSTDRVIAALRASARLRMSLNAAASPLISQPFAIVSLELIQQAVQIRRQQIGGVNRRERLAIRQPARAEIPSAFRGRAQIAINLGSRRARDRARWRCLLCTPPREAYRDRPSSDSAPCRRANSRRADAPIRERARLAPSIQNAYSRLSCGRYFAIHRLPSLPRPARSWRRRTAAANGSSSNCGCRSECGRTDR